MYADVREPETLEAVWLQEQVLAGKRPAGFEKDIEKHLTVGHDGSGAGVRIRQEAIDQGLATSGWVVIVGVKTSLPRRRTIFTGGKVWWKKLL
jgi:hypothetical protein